MQEQLVRTHGGVAIPAVNFHLWGRCNMRCKFCFARFERGKPEPKEDSRQKSFKVIEEVARAGIEKITFAGGEPLLCPWLGDALAFSKSLGLTTMVVTNGSVLTPQWLGAYARHVDWIALSTDSLNPATNVRIGRAVGGRVPILETEYLALIKRIKAAGIRLKINMTVSAFNKGETLCDFIVAAKPERLKVFQVLPIDGQNDQDFETLKVSSEEFAEFLQRHEKATRICPVVAEGNEAMLGSYLMIDPQGRFYSNASGSYCYSRPIWEVGWDSALSEVYVSAEKFYQREGHYDW